MTLVSKLPINCVSEENENIKKRNGWTNLSRILSKNVTSYSSSHFTQRVGGSKPSLNYPFVVSAYNFDFSSDDIPDDATINRVLFRVHMRVGGGVTALVPSAHFNIYGSSSHSRYDNTKSQSTGWNDGIYCVYPAKRLSTNWETYSFIMEEDDVKRGGFQTGNFFEDFMGVDLVFSEPKFSNDYTNYTARVDIAWIECIIDYTVPKFELGFGTFGNKTSKSIHQLYSTSSESPMVYDENVFDLTIFLDQLTDTNVGSQVYNIDLPLGTEVLSYNASKGQFNPNDNTWTVNANGVLSEYLTLKLKCYVFGVQSISVANNYVSNSFYYRVNRGSDFEYDTIKIGLESEPHHNHKLGITIDINGVSFNDIDRFVLSTDNNLEFIDWEINEDLTDKEVTIHESDDSSIILDVPYSHDVSNPIRYNASLIYYCYPKDIGDNQVTVTADNQEQFSGELEFEVGDDYTYHIGSNIEDAPNHLRLNGDVTSFVTHKIVTVTESDDIVLPFYVADGDELMTQSRSNIHFNDFEAVDYIGCVQLEQTHFNPKSTYKDKLLDTHYKNKRYMGKELAPDEDITLNIRLHPKDVTTIQGLIDMDKPIPINTNHKSFEGDSLNHRGWCEIYSIKSERTNPHWYKCDIDVKYLTHNLNSRFNILRGEKSNKYNPQFVYTETHTDGEAISSGDDTQDFFIVDTDGVYFYDDDEDSEIPTSMKNVFGINTGQHINVKSRKIEAMSEVVFEWTSLVLSEALENNIKRVVRLRDYFTHEVVFEYEYEDFEYTYDGNQVETITCSPIWRVYNKGDYDTYTEQIDFRMGFDSLEDTVSLDDSLEDNLSVSGDLTFGSTLHLKLVDSILTILDEGFNGKEIYQENIELPSSTYYWETDWINNSEEDLECYFNLLVNETILRSQFSNYYTKSVVSPFPIPDKTVIFTRDAEEGTLYYLEDDKEEFSYRIDPYYQYQNGTDLVSYDGISIFNMNYGYDIVYIQNGLVRMGFNRLNGELYLGKYDPNLKDYITTHNFHLKKYTDININSITDDKIVIQVSDALFTIWRGHPYIMVNHRGEDLLVDDKFNKVWGESVNDNPYTELPTYWDLMNHANLLPASIGGTTNIKSSDATVTDREISDRTVTNIRWDYAPKQVYANQSLDYVVANCISGKPVVLMVNGKEYDTQTPQMSMVSFPLKFEALGKFTLQAFLLGDDETQMSYTPLITVNVIQPTDGTGVGAIKLAFVNKGLKEMEYNDGQNITFRMTQGDATVVNRAVKLVSPYGTLDRMTITDNHGMVFFKNTGYAVGKYKIGAYYNDDNNYLVAQTYKWVEIKKGTPTIQVDNYDADFVKGDKVIIRLRYKGKDLTDERLTIYVNGKAYSRKTNSNGLCAVQFTNIGIYKFKIVYKGSNNLNSTTKTYTFNVGGN